MMYKVLYEHLRIFLQAVPLLLPHVASVSHNPSQWRLWVPPQRSVSLWQCQHRSSQRGMGNIEMFVLPQQESESCARGQIRGYLSISWIGSLGEMRWKNQLSFCVLLGLHLLLTSPGGRWEEGISHHIVSYMEIGAVFSSRVSLLQRKIVERIAIIRVCRRHNFCFKIFLKCKISSSNLGCAKCTMCFLITPEIFSCAFIIFVFLSFSCSHSRRHVLYHSSAWRAVYTMWAKTYCKE